MSRPSRTPPRQRVRMARLTAARLAAALAVLAAWACSNPDAVGNVVLGTFDFQVEPLAPDNDGCAFNGAVDMPTGFTRTLSYDTASGKAYLTANSQSHVGTLVNGWLSVQASARRQMPQPCDCAGTIVETITGQLVPESTLASCAGLPDGGLSAADAGTALPSDAGMPGYDLLCNGTLVDAFQPDSPDGGCPAGCQMRYRVTGVRQ